MTMLELGLTLGVMLTGVLAAVVFLLILAGVYRLAHQLWRWIQI